MLEVHDKTVIGQCQPSLHLFCATIWSIGHNAATDMHWDYIVILSVLAFFVPWQSRARIRMLLQLPTLLSSERIALYLSTIAFQWAASGIIAWRCLAHGFSLSFLGIAFPHEARTVIATVLLSALLVLNQIFGTKRLVKLPVEKRGLIAQLAGKLLPRTETEKCIAVALVSTVAICEEFIYRGFVQALFHRVLVSVLAGALISAGFFALAHLYQGLRGIFTTFIVGLVFSAVRIWTGSLWPSTFIHFAVDFSAGLAFSRVFSTQAW